LRLASIARISRKCAVQPFDEPAWIAGKISDACEGLSQRVRALCCRRALLAPAGALIAAFGSQSLYEGFLTNRCEAIHTGGAFSACTVGALAFYEGAHFIKEQLGDAKRIVQQKRLIRELNQELLKEPGASNEDAILVAIDASDHNKALSIDAEFIENMKRMAQGFRVHCVLVEKPRDIDRACDALQALGKKIRHVNFWAHGTMESVKIGGQKIRTYLSGEKAHPGLQNIERCLFMSCGAGITGGEGHTLSIENENLTVYAPNAPVTPAESFCYLDQEKKPAAIHITENELVTKIYHRSGIRKPYPIAVEKDKIIHLSFHDPAFMDCFSKLHDELHAKAAKGDPQSERMLTELFGSTVYIGST